MSDAPEVPFASTLAPLAPWLAQQLGATDLVIGSADRPSSGFSAETVVFDAAFTLDGQRDDRKFVLRRESPDPPVYPVQVPGWQVAVELQYRVMDAVARNSDVPIAPLLGYEPDPSVLDAPFFVMGHVAGQVPIESPPFPQEGFFTEATPTERRKMYENGLDVLAQVHRIDWEDAGLDWLVMPGHAPNARTQFDLWKAYGEAELRGRVHPLMDRAWAWLEANWPGESPPVLNWGDPRPGNMIWRDFECECCTDFEAASISAPEVDLGWWLNFDRTMHEAVGVDRLAGEPTREEQQEIYEVAIGRSMGDMHWWQVFAAARYCAIVVRVMNRAEARGLLPEGNTIWLENPPATCLEQLL